VDPTNLLSSIPEGLREPLLACYREIGANYAEHRWEPSELNGGKFCETVYSIINGVLTGSMPGKPSKPRNMPLACQALEKDNNPDANRPGDRSLRILIPRVLPSLYEIRNNRGVGHVGGDVDPNFLDATAVYSMTSWVLAELIRIFHNVSTDVAQAAVDAIIERKSPLIWEKDGIRRVLDPKMSNRNQSLLLLHGKPGWVEVKDLFDWVEYSSLPMFVKRIIQPLHKKERLIEYDSKRKRVHITPLGIAEVEKRILKSRT
jgi:hypothetical protein